ncbi:hypothetical protein [Niabella ginsenosidivorans]|uniref:hypothetical protein n=1 Tax=Niabella ginsenosidivorans TaxID=1176587 RepID=UPI0012ED200E|nr:hypothetical protein [Niabella ginsenosidivorans]
MNYNPKITPANGVKIKTNLIYQSSPYQMVTLFIDGYSYGSKKTIGLKLVYYIYNGEFINYSASSTGARTPKIFLANENGKVVVFLDDKIYYQHFTVSALCFGISATSFQGWSAVDEAVTGTNVKELTYENAFSGNVNFSGGIWNAVGNVGIGTTTPKERLSVNGNIRAKEIKVETANWPDYVFQPSYPLMSLDKIESFIKANGHLPDVPSAKEVAENGVEVGANQAMLLKKIEELTLHLIETNNTIKELQRENKAMKEQLSDGRKKVQLKHEKHHGRFVLQ